MIDTRITDLRFIPGPRSRWAALSVGMTLDEALAALGNRPNDRSVLYCRARRGEIVFDLPLPPRVVVASDISDADTGWEVEELPRQTVTRPCLCCRQPFESSGPGNRMCNPCRNQSVSPFAV